MFSLENEKIQKTIEVAQKNKFTIFLLIIFTLGVFLRTWHFSDWLHFETDQTDDFNIVSPAVIEGPENLRLLGPRAGAKELRIPPGFYYFEYLSAKIFGNTPVGHAMFVLITAILAIPIFYLFSRKYFSKKMALLLLYFFAISFYLIQYSRFSWNPNTLPLFTLLFGCTLLKTLSPKTLGKDKWFLITVTVFLIASQMHFNALFILGAVFVSMMLLKRPKIKAASYIWAILIAIFLYSPVIAHDVQNDWKNTRRFAKKIITGDGDKNGQQKETVIEKAVQNIRYSSGEFFLIASGVDIINVSRPQGISMGILCKNCKEDAAWRIIALLLHVTLLFVLFRKALNEKDLERKNFLQLLLVWFSFGTLFLFSLTLSGLHIYPRFYLIMAPISILLLGLGFEEMLKKKRFIGILAILITAITLTITNGLKIKDSFAQLASASTKPIEIDTEDVFPNHYRVTLETQQAAIDYMLSKSNQDFPFYIASETEFEPVYWLLLKQHGITYWNDIPLKNMYADGNYFLIYPTISKNDRTKKFLESYEISERKEMGVLTIWHITPKKNLKIPGTQPLQTKNIRSQERVADTMLSWKDFFSKIK